MMHSELGKKYKIFLIPCQKLAIGTVAYQIACFSLLS